MAKLSRLGITGASLTDADGGGAHDFTNDILDFSSTPTVATFDVTGIDKFKHERLGGLQDQQISLTLAVSTTNFRAHRLMRRGLRIARTLVLPTAPTTGGVTGVTQTLGVLIGNYGLSRNATGQLQAKATLKSQSGVVTYT